MQVILGILIIFILSLIASRFIAYKRFLPVEVKLFFYTYSEFLVLGFIVGPQCLGLLKQDFLSHLDPFLYLGLGWAGIFFGLQFNMQQIRRFSASLYMISFLQAAVTFILCFCVFLLLFRVAGFLTSAEARLMAALCGAVACISAPVAVSHFVDRRKSEDNDSMLLEFASSIDAIVGVIIFGILGSFFHSVDFGLHPTINIFLWFTLSLIIGIVLGVAFHSIILERSTDQELFLYIVGILIFSSATAYSLELSPLFINFIIGVVVANISLKRETIIRHLGSIEKPLYIVFLLLAGARWMFDFHLGYAIGALSVVYISVRMLGKVIGFHTATLLFKLPFKPKPILGVGLLGQGAIALTMLININLVYPESHFQVLVSAILGALLLNEIIAPFMIRRVLQTSIAMKEDTIAGE